MYVFPLKHLKCILLDICKTHSDINTTTQLRYMQIHNKAWSCQFWMYPTMYSVLNAIAEKGEKKEKSFDSSFPLSWGSFIGKVKLQTN